MAKDINVVIVSGNLVRDPDIRYTADKKAVASFTVATSKSVKGKDGEYKDITAFLNCSAWAYLAEAVQKKAQKGTKVLIEGELQTGSYEKAGQKINTTTINAREITFLQRMKDTPESQGNTEHGVAKANGYMPDSDFLEGDGDGNEADIPF